MSDTKQSNYAKRKAVQASEIGSIPTAADPDRRESCRLDLHRYLRTYFPHTTGKRDFSSDHRRIISRIQGCILSGGRLLEAVYRGFAKTTIAENSILWATNYGHRRFVPIFGATASTSKANMNSMHIELSRNPLLYADFPEVCYPIWALEGKHQRCASQTCGGFLTETEWTAEHVVLPTIYFDVPTEVKELAGELQATINAAMAVLQAGEDDPELARKRAEATVRLHNILSPYRSKSSGAIIAAKSIEAAARGMTFKRPDGTQQRPDFVFIDDPQTDATATSTRKTQVRLGIIRKTILKLGGHDRQIAAVMTGTVIQPDDLVDSILKRTAKEDMAWQGERVPMVKKWADAHETMWLGEYARLRRTYAADDPGSQLLAHKLATEFYGRNRAAMDSGAEVGWEHCFNHAEDLDGEEHEKDYELSAIQHVYNLLIDDGEEVFASECQNQPLRPENQEGVLTLELVMGKASGLSRGITPLWASTLVAFIDVQDNLLFWTVMAFGEQFRGHVVDYGTWPEQSRSHFSYKDARQKLTWKYPGMEKEAVISAGLNDLASRLLDRDWHREDKLAMRISATAVDSSDGDHSDIVYEFCRLSPHKAILRPSKGRGVTAAQVPWEMFLVRPGEKVGHHWLARPLQKQKTILVTEIDVNYWKTFVRDRFFSGKGGRGSLELFGKYDDHRLFAEHMLAEFGVSTEGRGRKLTEWKIRPNHADNHWWDCVVGCHALGSIQGVTLDVAGMVQQKKKRKHYTSADFSRARVAV
jgi:hypothetical protein